MSGPPPGIADLFIRFTQVGISGFGGVMPWARRMLVEERRWLSAEEFNEALSLCQVLPGPNIVNMAVCIGTRFRGALGAFAAVMGLMCAPFAIVLALGALFTHYGGLPAVSAAFRGISAAAAGLIVAMGIKMAASPRLRSPMAVFAVAAFVGVGLVRLPLGVFLLVAVPASVAAAAWRSR
ncbi:MAG TPA: chromate transporter [Burkholderiales bacterium]|nr:chromate transporter [Burkholderiales bacterium]HYA46166.1 chromate transporter [Burkholderiales bacterium]